MTHDPRAARRQFLAGGIAATGLAACTQTPPAPVFPAITFSHKGVFRLAVERVELRSTYAPPMRRPNIEHEVPVSPVETVRRWGSDRLAATGDTGSAAVFIVREAAMTETELRKETGLRATMTSQQDMRYDLALAATIEIRDSRSGAVVASCDARAAGSRSVAEGIALAARERAWYALTEQVMETLDAELERQVRAHLAPFLR